MLVLLASAAALVGLGGCDPNTRDTDIKLIRVGEVKALMDRQNKGEKDQMILIDPRPTKTYQAAHIPGAKNLLLPQVDAKGSRDPRLEDHGLLVVYGDDPGSAVARGMTKRLLAVGYKGVRFFAGGLAEWHDRGYAIDGATPPPPPAQAPAAVPATPAESPADPGATPGAPK